MLSDVTVMPSIYFAVRNAITIWIWDGGDHHETGVEGARELTGAKLAKAVVLATSNLEQLTIFTENATLFSLKPYSETPSS
jgi:hypothetical protein